MNTQTEQLQPICPNCSEKTERYLAYKAFNYMLENGRLERQPITSTEIEIDWCENCRTGVEVKSPVIGNVDLDDMPF